MNTPTAQKGHITGTPGKIADLIVLAIRLRPRRVALYAAHRFRLWTGWYRRKLPRTAWNDRPHPAVRSAVSIFAEVAPENVRRAMPEPAQAIAAGERILAGEMPYFSHHWLERPADWRTSPLTGFSTSDAHWSTLGDFDPRQGDIKWLWEASRFDWVYQLGRAWAASGDERFVEGFWHLLDDWRRHNPPQSGINWKCGQECSIRLFALVWAAACFARCQPSTARRLEVLWDTVATLATRVEAAISYALAQNNNHGLCESTGLLVAGCCLPDHPSAARWRARGERLFFAQVQEQFAPDGSYNHHSMNYERLALRICFIALNALRAFGRSWPDEVSERLSAAVRFLHALQEPRSGALPNYGANDGANILHLSGCTYEDFRPALQTMHALLSDQRLYPPGSWDEELAWHFAGSSLGVGESAEPPRIFRADDGGYYCLRSGDSRAMLRCHTFTSRPGHADSLHLDLWCDGVNVAVDSGSYLYYDDRGWSDHFKSTAAHNTVTVDGKSQMRPFRRFLWADWTRARLLSCDTDAGGRTVWQGEHTGYGDGRSGPKHRRTVHCIDGEWLVVDDLILHPLASAHAFALHWHLGGADDWRLSHEPTSGTWVASSEQLGLRLSIAADEDRVELLRGSEHYPLTGVSFRYGAIAPISLLRARRTADASFRWVSAIGVQGDLRAGRELQWNGRSIDLPLGIGGPSGTAAEAQ